MTDRNIFTYEHTIAGHLVWEADVRISYEGGPWGWLVEMRDLNEPSAKEWFKAPRDWHDMIMAWAQNKRQDELREMVRDHHTGQRVSEILAAAE